MTTPRSRTDRLQPHVRQPHVRERRGVGAPSATFFTMIALVAACGGDDAPARPGAAPAVTFATQATAVADSSAPSPVTSPDDTVPDTISSDATTAPASTADAPSTPAPTVPSGGGSLGDPTISLDTIGRFVEPIDVAWRAGDPTAFVAERPGRVVTLRDGVVGAPVLDITDLTEPVGEQGLLGLTFSADGAHAYINYTDNSGDTVIAEYVVGSDGNFDASSAREVLTIDQPYDNHNGGNVTVGPDGLLYIGMGDGGSGGDPERHALNASSLLGKILRIDPTPSGDTAYTVPADNPFVGAAGARPEIWSVGVRNPWRMSFDSATGDLWFGDVGQNEIEEIDVAWADQGGGRGLNFGWSAFEGTARYNEDQSPDGVTAPVHEYRHGDNTGCSVTGGAVYRGSTIPALVGWYVFADYCSGNLYAIRTTGEPVSDSLVLGKPGSVTAIREGPDGELYVLSVGGDMNRIVAA